MALFPSKEESSVQLLSRVWLFGTPWTAAHQASLSITNSPSLLKLKSMESVMPSNHLILCHPLLLPPSIIPSIRVFSNESALCIRWPKYWSLSFNISPSNEYLGLISFMMDWLDLLAVQGTLKSFLQHHSSKAFQCPIFLPFHTVHGVLKARILKWFAIPFSSFCGNRVTNEDRRLVTIKPGRLKLLNKGKQLALRRKTLS